jgi:hypothetical protein
MVRIGRDGSVQVRASSHHGYQGCKQRRCTNRWTAWTGWTRVSKGSHAGHIPLRTIVERAGGRPHFRRRYEPDYPGVDLRERTTTAEGLRLIPLETLTRARRRYRPLDPGIEPPWRKRTWRHPEDDGS